MFASEKEILSKIAGILADEPRVLKIIAFGSRARGDFREDSDHDVFVLVDRKDISIKKRIRDVFYDFEMISGIPFSVIIQSREEFDFNTTLGSPFIKSIKEEGIIIYDALEGREKIPLVT